MIKKIDHVVITTKNIEKCITFYESIGFKSKRDETRYELYSGEFKINVHIKGKELLPHSKNVTIGSADLCFEITEDINTFKEQLEKKNINIELGIVNRDGVYGEMKSFYIRDFDGNLIEFCNYEK